jgi:general stress protein 26
MNSERLLVFMREHRLGVQCTTSPNDVPQAAVVGFAVTDQLEIVFDTLSSTRKVQNLRANPRVAFVIGGLISGDERTLQLEGIADEPEGADLERLKRAYYAVFPEGPSRVSWPGLIYVRIRPTWFRYSDYNRDPPEIIEFSM